MDWPQQDQFEIKFVDGEYLHTLYYLLDSDGYRSQMDEAKRAEYVLQEHKIEGVIPIVVEKTAEGTRVSCTLTSKPQATDIVVFIQKEDDKYSALVHQNGDHAFVGDHQIVEEFWRFYEDRCPQSEHIHGSEDDDWFMIKIPEILTFDQLIGQSKEFNIFGDDDDALTYIKSLTQDEKRALIFLDVYKQYRTKLFRNENQFLPRGVIPLLANDLNKDDWMKKIETYHDFKKAINQGRYKDRSYDRLAVYQDADSVDSASPRLEKIANRSLVLTKDSSLLTYLPKDAIWYILYRGGQDKFLYYSSATVQYLYERVMNELGLAVDEKYIYATTRPSFQDALDSTKQAALSQGYITEHMTRTIMSKHGYTFDVMSEGEFNLFKDVCESIPVVDPPVMPAVDLTLRRPRIATDAWVQFLKTVKIAPRAINSDFDVAEAASDTRYTELTGEELVESLDNFDNMLYLLSQNREAYNAKVINAMRTRFLENFEHSEPRNYELLLDPSAYNNNAETFLYEYTEIAEIKEGDDIASYHGNMFDTTSGLVKGNNDDLIVLNDNDEVITDNAYGNDEDEGEDIAVVDGEEDEQINGPMEAENIGDDENILPSSFFEMFGEFQSVMETKFVNVVKELRYADMKTLFTDRKDEWINTRLKDNFSNEDENIKSNMQLMLRDYIMDVWGKSLAPSSSYTNLQKLNMDPTLRLQDSPVVAELVKIIAMHFSELYHSLGYNHVSYLTSDKDVFDFITSNWNPDFSYLTELWNKRNKRTLCSKAPSIANAMKTPASYAFYVSCQGRVEYNFTSSLKAELSPVMKDTIFSHRLKKLQTLPSHFDSSDPSKIKFKVKYGIPNLSMIHDDKIKPTMHQVPPPQNFNDIHNDLKRYVNANMQKLKIRDPQWNKIDLQVYRRWWKMLLPFVKEVQPAAAAAAATQLRDLVILIHTYYKDPRLPSPLKSKINNMLVNAFDVLSVSDVQEIVTNQRELEKKEKLEIANLVAEEDRYIQKEYAKLIRK